MTTIDIILIDDEKHALRELAFFLDPYLGIRILGMFTNPVEALNSIHKLQPDCVFLDIHMPIMNGIEFASRILDEKSDVDVIFVTAYNQYAVDAFELNALDYILKPFSEERFDKTVNRLFKKHEQKNRSPKRQSKFIDKTLEIKCLGEFRLQWHNEKAMKWRTRKTRELFAFLLHHHGKELSKERIVEAIWPESDPDAAASQLYSGIYYIKKSLQSYRVPKDKICISGKYCMNLGNILLDKTLFEKYIADQLEPNKNDVGVLSALEKQAELYTGEYFEGEGWIWTYPGRMKLLEYYLTLVFRIVEIHIENKSYSKAETLLLKAFQKDPYRKKITLTLIELYHITKEKVKAAKHFALYEALLNDDLGIKPEYDIVKAYKVINKI